MGFLETMRRAGVVVDPDVFRALGKVARAPHYPAACAPLLSADIPVPRDLDRPAESLCPSPTILGLFLQLLDLEPRLDVALVGGDSYALALLDRLVSPGDVAAFTGRDEEVAGRWDRIVTLHRDGLGPDGARDGLRDGGFSLQWCRGKDGPELAKVLRGGDDFVEMRVTDLAPSLGGPQAGPSPDTSLYRLITLNELMENAWRDVQDGPHDAQLADVVEDTFEDPEEAADRLGEETYRAWGLARKAFHCAYIRQVVGDLPEAIDAYRASIAAFPTAEAHTFLGWTHSFSGNYDGAIAACHEAIAIDPSFGNPYNDIGAYLLELGRVDEAIPWFQQAKEAGRYCCYFYAYSNLGRAYLMKGMPERARREFEEALRLNPSYELAAEMLKRLDADPRYFG